jgi:nitric oxide synthase oxygenase domain/subunit
METGKIRFVMFDPLSREAIYRGTLHIEYANQDPDIVEPINIEKISKRFEWEGTNSD